MGFQGGFWMVVTKQNLVKAIPYLLSKLAGAGFLLFIFFIYGVLSLGVDMYETVEGISYWFIPAIVFSFFTILIDLLIYKLAIKNSAIIILLYMIAGFVFFISKLIFVILIWGSIISLIIYFGFYISIRYRKFRYVFSIVIPFLLFILINFDFTVKKGWKEISTSTSYEATYDFFNGKHEIPLQLEEGKTLVLSENFENTNDGGHGFYVLNEKDRKIGMKMNGNVLLYTANETGVYRLVFIGDDVKGYFNVKWEIE